MLMDNNIHVSGCESFMLYIIFGGVFFTSEKFVNVTNTPEFYFILSFLLVAIIIVAISRKYIKLGTLKNRTIHWEIFVVCILQACYGLCQHIGWFPSNYSNFVITGSFDNPAGFAAVLAIGFPIGLFLVTKTKIVERYLVSAILVVIAIAVFLSGSRTGMLAIIVSSVVFLLLKSNIMSKLQQYGYYKLLAILIIACFIAGTSILYHQKKDSADGRFLIWKVSTEMIKDRPIWGHGYEAFQAKYMDYQTEYFKNNPDSEFELLADNVKHPFNEFIKIAVEFGVTGLLITLIVIGFILWKTIKSGNKYKSLVLSGMTAFLVFACFSYPLQYVAVWLLLAFYLSILLPSKEIKIRNTPIFVATRIAFVVVFIFALFHISRRVDAEIKWKPIAMNSLKGNTEKMLPEYKKLYLTALKRNPFFLYNYGAELNVAGRFDRSIEILTECKKWFNDYDLQILLADNYSKKGETEKAIQIYRHASNMVPCRFLPTYQIFEIYRKLNQKDCAIRCANEIMCKKVKIQSVAVASIKSEAKRYINENKETFINTTSIDN